MTKKIIKEMLKDLNEAEKYIYEAFMYLKELEDVTPKNPKLQKAIWDLCEAGEFVGNGIIYLECDEDE